MEKAGNTALTAVELVYVICGKILPKEVVIYGADTGFGSTSGSFSPRIQLPTSFM